MGSTIVEKIFARSLGRDVTPGEYVEISSRLAFVQMGGPRGWATLPEDIRYAQVANPKLIRLVDGHAGISPAFNAAESRSRGRAWAKKQGVPLENIYELGRSGMEHVTASEKGWVLPGEFFFAGTNGHTSAMGALGAFAITMSTGSAGYAILGKTWMKVPGSVKIIVNGNLPKGVFGRDVAEYVMGQIGPSAAVGKVIEWTGPVIEAMSMDGRFSICCQAVFCGAWTAIMNPDQNTIEYLKARTSQSFDPLRSDPDAKYAKVYEIDVSNISPQVVPPPVRHKVFPVNELEGRAINRAFVGTCANSRMEDMRIVGQILKGRKIDPEVIFNITPGTPGILKQCVQEGLMEIFIDAEAAVGYPCCGMCAGLYTPLADADVCIASGTTNYAGRMGSEEAQIYLASPATVAASALEGKITDPRKYL